MFVQLKNLLYKIAECIPIISAKTQQSLSQSLTSLYLSMAPMSSNRLATFLVLGLLFCSAHGVYLRKSYYDKSCPNLQSIVWGVVKAAVDQDKTMGPCLLRLQFHDCFTCGCDASILLDYPPSGQSEKNAPPNANSVCGYGLIDSIKTEVEKSCPKTVSCADILAIAARDGVHALGGPSYDLTFGRKDSDDSCYAGTNDLPSPDANYATLKQIYDSKNLTEGNMVALSGAHTIGKARCFLCRNHIYNDNNINANYSAECKKSCPQSGGDSNPLMLDYQTPYVFDNQYYINLVNKTGLLHSDQELYNHSPRDYQVREYSKNVTKFFYDFGVAMRKMGSLQNPGATKVRLTCSKVN